MTLPPVDRHPPRPASNPPDNGSDGLAVPAREAGREGLRQRLERHLREHDPGGLAAEIAFRFVLAAFPFGVFVAALSALVAQLVNIENPADKIVAALGDNLPGSIANVVRPELERVIGTARPGLLSLGALAALWAGTGATNAVVKGMNRAYGLRETRPFLLRYAVAVGLTLLATFGIVASFVTIVGGALVTQQVAALLGLGDLANEILYLLRWPVVFVALTAAVAVLYRHAPNVVVPWRWVVLGAAVFTTGWLAATALFAFYLSGIANLGATYGSLAGIIVLLLWFYVTAILQVAGAELIAAVTLERTPESIHWRREEIEAEHALATVTGEAKRAAERAIGAVADAAGLSDDEEGAATV